MTSPLIKKQIIEEFENKAAFFDLIYNKNPGLIIVKFGAKWCGPCKKIKQSVDAFFALSPDNVICADLDVDIEGNIDIYGYLTTKKMVRGIPAILCYKRNSPSLTMSPGVPIPDDSFSPSSKQDEKIAEELKQFFIRCGNHLATVKN
jgi:thiol-disulfide isomerase/thioredoxin